MNNLAFSTFLEHSPPIVVSAPARITEQQLLAGLRSGEQRSIETLYDMYCGALYGIIFRIVKDDETAEDILQETFVRIWQCISYYDSAKARLYTWMANIARNLALDKIKSKAFKNSSRNEKLEDVQLAVDSQMNVSSKSDTIGVKEMVARLKPEYKCIIDLVYYNGYTHVEAAEELNIPLGTLKTRIRMAMNELRKFF